MRLAVTDRCNLRCQYCMPEEGINFLKNKQLLSYDEMLRIVGVLHPLGVKKIRITGGEPFIRKDLIHFLRTVKNDYSLDSFSITTNGTLIGPYLDELPQLFDTINFSLDSLDNDRFKAITKRDNFDEVLANIEHLITKGINVKVNVVVLKEQNIEDIIPFVKWTENKNVEVRFIEEMPFNGSRSSVLNTEWDYVKILNHIKSEFKDVQALPNPPSSTSMSYQVKNFRGRFGVIPAFSRTFCGTCNRIRITAKGELRTCLYSKGGINLLQLMRNGCSDKELQNALLGGVLDKEKNGFEAAKDRASNYESMTTIGG